MSTPETRDSVQIKITYADDGIIVVFLTLSEKTSHIEKVKNEDEVCMRIKEWLAMIPFENDNAARSMSDVVYHFQRRVDAFLGNPED